MISTVKMWKEDKGYGFITNPDGGKDIFVHHRDIIGRNRKSLRPGQPIEFTIEETEKGLSARNAVPH